MARRGGGLEGRQAGPLAPPTMRVVDLLPDVDYASVAAAALAGPIRPEELGSHLSRAWAQAYRSRLPQTSLLEFDSDGARFLFDLASAAGAERADRTVAAWGRSRPAPRPRDQAYQRGYPSPQGRADRPLDKGHMVAHAAGGTFGPNMFLGLTRFDGHPRSGALPRRGCPSWRSWKATSASGLARDGRSPQRSRPRSLSCA